MEITNRTKSIMLIINIKGSEMKNVVMICLSEYSSMCFFEIREKKNKKIRNASSGKKINIPTTGRNGITAMPTKSQTTKNKYLQFSFNSSKSLKVMHKYSKNLNLKLSK